MIPILYFSGFKANDPLDGLSARRRMLLHVLVCIVVSITMVIMIDSVFKIVFFAGVKWKIAEVFMFGVLYALIIINTRKSGSLFHFLIILIPLYLGDIYLEAHCLRTQTDKAIWNYYPGSFVFDIKPIWIRFLVTLSFDALLMGPVCLWISRMIATIIVKKGNNHFNEAYFRLFNEKRTNDQPIILPERIKLWSDNCGKNLFKRIDFSFWIIRILGIFFLSYLGILLMGALGTVSMGSNKTIWPDSLAKLMSDTYANAFHHVHTIGKISNFILLAMSAAFHLKIRFLVLRIFMLGNLVAAVCSFYLYYFSSRDAFLFQSGIADSLVTIVSLILLLISRKHFDKSFTESKFKIKDATIAEKLLIAVYLVIFLLFAFLFIMLVGGFLIGNAFGEFFDKWYALIHLPEAMLLNSITFSFTSALMAFYCFRYTAVRSILSNNLTDPILFSTIAATIWTFYYYMTSLEDPGLLKNYLIIYVLLGFFILFALQKVRSLYYNMNFQITSMHPCEVDTAVAAVSAIYGIEGVHAEAAALKTDKFIASIKGRKRGLINFPFYILENILCPFMALRPRFSTMGLDERCYFLKKYILRKPNDVASAFIPELANVANKIGISIKAISSLSYLSTNEGRTFVGYVEPERRDRYETDTQFFEAPFGHLSKLPRDENSTSNYRPTETIPQHAMQAKGLSTANVSIQLKAEYDYIIVGSGAAGAVMAYRLIEEHQVEGDKILLIERGSRLSRHTDMNDDEMEMLAKLYKEGGLQQTKKFDMVVLQGEALGGTTVINNAVCLEMTNATMQTWANEYGISFPHIKAHYQKIRKEINIHPLNASAINQVVRSKFIKGVQGYNQSHNNALNLVDPLEVNARYEDGDGLWNLGNKRGKKLSMDETYIIWAESRGLNILTKANVLKFLSETNQNSSQANQKATCVVVEHNNKIVEIKIGKKLVICGGCIASTHLIMRSTEDGPANEALGKNMACNYAFPFAFEFDDKIKAYDGTQITLAAMHNTESYIFETYFNPPAAFAITLPFNFETHRKVLANYNHCLNFGILLGSSNVGNIDKNYNHLTGRAFSFDLSASNDLQKIKSAMRDMVKLGKYAGAKSVTLPLNPGLRLDLSDDSEYQKFLDDFDAYELKQSDLILSTAHPQGGNAMIGMGSGSGVVGTDFLLKGFENVHVADASIFPSSIGVNPQWTIMALSSIASGYVIK